MYIDIDAFEEVGPFSDTLPECEHVAGSVSTYGEGEKGRRLSHRLDVWTPFCTLLIPNIPEAYELPHFLMFVFNKSGSIEYEPYG